MFPPPGFKSEVFPLRHRLVYKFGLSAKDDDNNTAMMTLVRHTNDIITTGAGVPKMIIVNPKNTAYVEDAGPAVCNMSIIDKLSMSLKFNLTERTLPAAHTSGLSGSEVFTGDGIQAIRLLWRPIFFSFQEKLLAADDDTGTTVEAILGVTSDTTFEDVVPLSTTSLPPGGSALLHPVSTVNIAEVFGDYNMTTDMSMEDQPWDEDLLQAALRRYTNKGALKACIGRTRHLTLTPGRPWKNYFIDKFVPRAIRRVQPYTFMAIQVHIPILSEVEQSYLFGTGTSSVPHVGVSLICNYHEWNQGHYQDPEGVPPTSA